MTNILRWSLLLALALAGALPMTVSAGLTGPKGDTQNEKRAAIRKERDEILAKLYLAHPEAKSKMDKAAGYATFNNKSLKLVLLSAGTGYGLVVDRQTGKETFMDMGTLGGGLGLGAKSMRAVFIFKDAGVLKKFVESGWQFGGEADASAKAAQKGGAAAKEGAVDTGGNLIEIYQMTETGFALQATIAGTKYWKDKNLNE
jgi:lipid-binding SYLF domain-containing protein